MKEFDIAKNQAIELISKTNGVSVLDPTTAEALGFKKGSLVLEVLTEYMDPQGIGRAIAFHVALGNEFPLVIPKIYLPANQYEAFRYLPHIDSNRLICTFDPETTRTDVEQPGRIVLECLKRAKAIIEKGLGGTNQNDYEAEFIAYWENKYGDQDEILTEFLTLINGRPIAKLKLVELDKPLAAFSHIIYQEDVNSKQFFKYLDASGRSFREQSICYIGDIAMGLRPPFALQNRDIDAILSKSGEAQRQRFIKYMNSNEKPKVLAATVMADGKSHLISWKHKEFIIKKNKRYRSGTMSRYITMKMHHSNEYVTRISPKEYTLDKVSFRTDGRAFPTEIRRFLIVGLGSIGSNLLYFLNSLPTPELHLIDPDLLSIGNINRHFLGFMYVGLSKVHALKDFFKAQNPLQEISVQRDSIINLLSTDPDYINNCDYLFLTTGKANVDAFISQQLSNGLITKPVFILWVEPFLCAGHILYLYPGDKTYSDYFDPEGYFNHNVIDKQEYLKGNSFLSMREAGCQSSYVPYSQSSVTAFLSSVFPVITRIILEGATHSQAFSWIGNLKQIEDLNVEFDSQLRLASLGTVIKHK